MDHRHEDQQRRLQLLNIVDRGNPEQLFTFLQAYHRRPFPSLQEVLAFDGVIDDQIDFIDCIGTRYNVTPLIIAAGKGSYEKTKILLVHGANPNKQCSTGDTALNLAVHRQKYHIADLLLKYRANPNVFNQSGKTALHRAVASYVDENANHIRTLLNYGADPTIEDRNQRIPLDEAVIANKPEILSVLLSQDRNLVNRSYRAAIIAARLGHDKCLETLLDYGMDPNISDRTHTTPLHVAVRSLKTSTAKLLVTYGADRNAANNRGETPMGIAEYLQPEQQQTFINVLLQTPRLAPSELRKLPSGATPGGTIPYAHPLLRSHPNWTMDSDDFRSRTTPTSSVQNLLDTSSGTYWSSALTKDAWVIFDLKHQYNISGMRIIGCDNQSTPKNGHIDVSNAFNGPWLRVKDFACPFSQRNTHDFFFTPLKTRFIRVFISENYGGDDIRIQGIGFYGVDMRLVNLLREHGLERSLNALLANGINDQETLDEKKDEILNSSDTYLGVNDHFQLLKLVESLQEPKLTHLEWFNAPQSTVIAGEKLQTFSATGDEGVTDRVRLEEKLEKTPEPTTVLLRDLEPIQGRSLVDFPDYSIKEPGRYMVRVVSIDSPDIHTPWREIVVGAKPRSVPTHTANGPHVSTSGIVPLRPSSTPPTDIDDELRVGPNFHKRGRFRQTPGPYRSRSGDDDDYESDIMSQRQRINDPHHGPPPPKDFRQPTHSRLINVTTQSEEKPTRNSATMPETIPTRNFGTMPVTIETRSFGTDIQPTTSSTQTPLSSPHRQHVIPASTSYVEPYLERTPPSHQLPRPRENGYHRRHEILSDDRQEPNWTLSPRASPPPQSPNQRYSPQRHRQRTPSPEPHYSPERHRQRTPSPEPRYSPERHRQRTPPPETRHSPQRHRQRTPSPPQQQSPPRRSPQRRRPRPPRCEKETDTSQDGMISKRHVGAQPDPPSSKDKATTPSLRTKQSPDRRRPLDDTFTSGRSPSRFDQSPTRPGYSSQYRDRSPPQRIPSTSPPRRTRSLPRPIDDEYDYDEEEEKPCSMHDRSIQAELNGSFDHYTQCEDTQPLMVDGHVQTTPDLERIPYNEEEQEGYVNLSDDEEEAMRKLARQHSTSISQPEVIQPPTLPRQRDRQLSRSNFDGIDYNGENLEMPVRQGKIQRLTPVLNSPLLNIGTEHTLRQSPTNESATPFETRYIKASNEYCSGSMGSIRHSSPTRRDDLRSSSSTVLLPVLNMSRTYVFEKQTLPDNNRRRQSTSSPHKGRPSSHNQNFLLSPNTHPLDSFSRDDGITDMTADNSAIDTLTRAINPTNVSAYGRRPQVA